MATDGVPRPPDWKALYQLAVMEQDPAKLPHRISQARSVILDRIQETLATPSHYSERQELSDVFGQHRAQQQLRGRLQQAIADAEEADTDFLAMAAVATDDAAYVRVLRAADRARLALACDEAFARWKLALSRHVSERQ